MTTISTEPHDTKLSSTVTIANYRQLELAQDRYGIAEFIQVRFTERYITPLRGDASTKHGFCTMAISCLMIETLESFEQGWGNTKNKSKQAFESFFARNQNDPLGIFRENAGDFWKQVRCGILHQGETRGGWHIRRDGPLFTPATRTINATKFHDELEQCLTIYCEALKHAEWNDDIWKNLRKKMDAICSNSVPSNGT